MTTFIKRSSPAAQMKPTRGEIRSDFPMLPACDQSTPLVPDLGDRISLARPTPMIDPMSVCELEDGKPKYQVPRFQMMAATSSAKTIAKPAPPPTWRISSTGSSEMMPKATVPVDTSTPMKFQQPDQRTAACGSSECV